MRGEPHLITLLDEKNLHRSLNVFDISSKLFTRQCGSTCRKHRLFFLLARCLRGTQSSESLTSLPLVIDITSERVCCCSSASVNTFPENKIMLRLLINLVYLVIFPGVTPSISIHDSSLLQHLFSVNYLMRQRPL